MDGQRVRSELKAEVEALVASDAPLLEELAALISPRVASLAAVRVG
jgi:hypothetical protein